MRCQSLIIKHKSDSVGGHIKRLIYLLGFTSSFIFFLQDMIGIVLWKGYNPFVLYISVLTADGAPNLVLMRTLANISRVCMLLFTFLLILFTLKQKYKSIPIGYCLLFIMSAVSLFGFGLFPATIDFIFSKENLIHVIITIFMLAVTFFALFSLSAGYIRKNKTLGKITLYADILFLIFNLMHLIGILNSSRILGLLQRLTIYTFYIYTFILSLFLMKDHQESVHIFKVL